MDVSRINICLHAILPTNCYSYGYYSYCESTRFYESSFFSDWLFYAYMYKQVMYKLYKLVSSQMTKYTICYSVINFDELVLKFLGY